LYAACWAQERLPGVSAVTFSIVQATLEVAVPGSLNGQRSIKRHASHLHFDTGSFSLPKTDEKITK
jgi:hypothetical protein